MSYQYSLLIKIFVCNILFASLADAAPVSLTIRKDNHLSSSPSLQKTDFSKATRIACTTVTFGKRG
jgi:hypothetical protein